MFAGLFLFGLVLVVVGISILCAKYLMWVVKCVGFFMFSMVHYIYHKTFVKSELDKNGFYEKKINEENLAREIEEAKKEKKHNEQVKEEHDKIVYATLQKTRELQAKYSLADKELFDEYMKSLNTKTMKYCDQIVELMKIQHNDRMNQNEARNYSLEEILTMNKIESKTQDDIEATMYQKNNDYAVVIHNMNTNMNVTYVTKDIVLAKRIIVSMMQAQMMKAINYDANVKDSLNSDEMHEIISKAVNDVSGYKK